MTDRVRLLGKTGGYTDRPSRAMDPAEPEAVDSEVQRRITAEAARSWPHMNALQTAERMSRPLHARIARAKAQARHLGVDIHPQMRLVRLALENGRPAEHIERRLEAVEQVLWPSR